MNLCLFVLIEMNTGLQCETPEFAIFFPINETVLKLRRFKGER